MPEVRHEWYEIGDIKTLDSPALVVYPERIRQNIQASIAAVKDVQRLRPHVKTHKSREVSQLLMSAGIRKFKCSTIAEAEMLGMCGADNVVLAYQPIGPKVQRLINVVKKYSTTKYSCLIDNRLSAKRISDACIRNGLTLSVYVDLNIGQNRSGITPGMDALELYKEAAGLPGITPMGLHAYDGHIRTSDFVLRTRQCNEAFSHVEDLKEELMNNGFPEPLIIAGGSPTFPIHSKRRTIDCSPGTFVYWDKSYLDTCAEQDFIPAAVLVTRIISLPGATKVCVDLGHKSVASENDISRRVFFLNAEGLTPVSQNEEHLVLEVPAGHHFEVGDVLYALPFHICPTVALYERVYTIENGKISGEWKNIARDRKIVC